MLRKLRPRTIVRVPGVALPEGEQVARLGGSKRIQRLVVVADTNDVSVRAGQQSQQRALGLVGVLVLVDQQVAPALAVEREPVGVFGQQPDRVDQQAVEVKRVAALQFDVELAPGRGDDVGGRVTGRLLVAVGGQQPVLGQ